MIVLSYAIPYISSSIFLQNIKRSLANIAPVACRSSKVPRTGPKVKSAVDGRRTEKRISRIGRHTLQESSVYSQTYMCVWVYGLAHTYTQTCTGPGATERAISSPCGTMLSANGASESHRFLRFLRLCQHTHAQLAMSHK